MGLTLLSEKQRDLEASTPVNVRPCLGPMTDPGNDPTPESVLIEIYSALENAYGCSQGWPDGNWPASGRFEPRQFEVAVGAVLTQNTSWTNVEKALDGLVAASLTNAEAIVSGSPGDLEGAIRSSGFYRQKSIRLKRLARQITDFPGDFYAEVSREQLLSLSGIGPETADSILLYACGRPHFVVDAYTRRICNRYGFLAEGLSYEGMQTFFEQHLPKSVAGYRRFHAFLVEHAKEVCRKRPRCSSCVLKSNCERAHSELALSFDNVGAEKRLE